MRLRGLIAAMALMLFGSVKLSAQDDCKQAVTAYQSKNYTEAIKWFAQCDAMWAARYMMLANAYYMKNEYEQALKNYQEVLNENNSNSDALEMMAKSHVELKNYEQAIVFFNKAIEQNDRAELRYSLAKAYYSKGDYNEAINNFKHTDRSSKYNYLADIYFKQKNYSQCIKSIDSALVAEPNREDLLQMKAYCLNELSDEEQTRKTYEQLVKIDPNNEQAKRNLELLNNGNLVKSSEVDEDYNRLIDLYSNKEYVQLIDRLAGKTNDYRRNKLLGYSYFEQGNYTKAIEALEKSNQESADDELLNYLGVAYNYVGNEEMALSSFQKAYTLNNNNELAAQNYGQMAFLSKRYSEANLVLSKLNAENKLDAGGIFYLGKSKAMLGDFISAISLLEKAISLKPNEEEFYHELAETYELAKQYSKATETYKLLLSQFGETPELNYKAGVNLYRIDNFVEAWPYIEKAAEAMPEDKSAQMNAGSCLSQMRRYGDAGKYLEKALKIDPNYATALYLMGIVEWNTGKPKKAQQTLLRAKSLDDSIVIPQMIREYHE